MLLTSIEVVLTFGKECSIFTGSHRSSFLKKVLRNNFAKFTGKYQCWSLLFNFTKSLQHRYFLLNFAKFLKNLFYKTPLVVTFFACCDNLLQN